ncbi:aspartate carbamoyltransferase [Patescibacteria group bacterium]|nr:aspartate carbamoyltransferase [Patescibacteria group bacterium]
MNLLYSKDLKKDEILSLIERAERYLPVVCDRRKVSDAEGKMLATLFYEPSTRTRFSFEAAMLRLGGMVISNPHMEYTSSAKKGETLYDTGRVISRIADVIAMRHPEKGSVEELSKGTTVPVVNAGDGPSDHPTQGLLDLYTIYRSLGRLDNFTVAMVGDLKYGRVPHAQCELLSNFAGVDFIFVAPEALQMPGEIVKDLEGKGCKVTKTSDLASVMNECDVLALTRIQKERFENEEEYLKYKGVYVMTPELMDKAAPDMILMHPLPRVDEIEVAVDSDPRAKYFEQVENGVAMRMAVLADLLQL